MAIENDLAHYTTTITTATNKMINALSDERAKTPTELRKAVDDILAELPRDQWTAAHIRAAKIIEFKEER